MPEDPIKPPESPLRGILSAYRATSQSEREKGTYFEELIRTYFRNEPKYADLYSDIWLYADWHLSYQTSALHEDIVVDVAADCIRPANHDQTPAWRMQSTATFRVEKMKFAKTKDPQTNKSVADKTTVIYNPRITLRHIPLEAYGYVVNGKPALEWVMERQSVTTDKASGITNDANLWATETMNNPSYPLELFLRVAKVSVETMRIVEGLPGLEID